MRWTKVPKSGNYFGRSMGSNFFFSSCGCASGQKGVSAGWVSFFRRNGRLLRVMSSCACEKLRCDPRVA